MATPATKTDAIRLVRLRKGEHSYVVRYRDGQHDEAITAIHDLCYHGPLDWEDGIAMGVMVMEMKGGRC